MGCKYTFVGDPEFSRFRSRKLPLNEARTSARSFRLGGQKPLPLPQMGSIYTKIRTRKIVAGHLLPHLKALTSLILQFRHLVANPQGAGATASQLKHASLSSALRATCSPGTCMPPVRKNNRKEGPTGYWATTRGLLAPSRRCCPVPS